MEKGRRPALEVRVVLDPPPGSLGLMASSATAEPFLMPFAVLAGTTVDLTT